MIARENQVNLFFTRRVDDEIDETALNLRPFVTHFVRQAVGIFLERLMQHPNEKKTPIAPRRRLGKLLEDVDVGTVLGGGFEKLSQLVDEEDEPAVRPGLFGGRAGQCGDQVGFGPAAARSTGYKPHPLHGFADDSDGILASRNDGKDAPSPRARRQCVPDRFRQLLAEDASCFPLQSGVAVQQSTKGND